jgi:hypothetical protein
MLQHTYYVGKQEVQWKQLQEVFTRCTDAITQLRDLHNGGINDIQPLKKPGPTKTQIPARLVQQDVGYKHENTVSPASNTPASARYQLYGKRLKRRHNIPRKTVRWDPR